jgi:hypothetical protein
MKTTMTFGDDEDDQWKLRAARMGEDAISVLRALDDRMRSIIKYGEQSDDVTTMVEGLRTLLNNECAERSVDLWE